MNYLVREYLINKAANEDTIGYQQLSNSCHLELEMQFSNHRAQIGQILGEISTYEHNHGRPLLSAIVVRQGDRTEGSGFFKLAEELGYGSWQTLRDSAFDVEQIKACFDFWSNPENYDQYRNIE